MSFSLSDVLKDVSNLDTNREQIEYIRRDLIHPDPNNFYALSGLDRLADNIATCGLQQPIRVRPHPDQPGSYMIVSGHRRNAAIEILAKEDPDAWAEPALHRGAGEYLPQPPAATADLCQRQYPHHDQRRAWQNRPPRWRTYCTSSRKRAVSSPAECGITWRRLAMPVLPSWPGSE